MYSLNKPLIVESKTITMVKPAVLSIAMLTVMAGAAVSPAMGNIAAHFANSPVWLVKLVVTLPPLMVVPGSVLASLLVAHIGKKHTIAFGIALYIIGGCGGGLAQNVPVLLLFRAILGVSVGLIMPIANALVSDFYQDREATQMMGWISSASHFSGMVAQLLSGVLAGICWRYSFTIYGVAFFSLLLVLFFLPKDRTGGTPDDCEVETLPSAVYYYATAIFLLMLLFYTVPVNISLFIERGGIGNSVTSGIACALITGSAFIIGLFFRQLKELLGRAAFFLGIMTMAMGFFVLYSADSALLVYLGVTLVGCGEGFLFPLFLQGARVSVGLAQTVSVMAIMSSMLCFGQFSSPLVIDSMSRILPVDHTLGSPFLMAGMISTVLFVVATIHSLFTKTNVMEKKDEK